MTILIESGGASVGKTDILKFKPDLVFVDIEMPFGNGFSMLEELNPINFEVIFVTAYDQYAIKAINCSAPDYIVKPIDEKELIIAIDKCSKYNSRLIIERLALCIKNIKSEANRIKTVSSSYERRICFCLRRCNNSV